MPVKNPLVEMVQQGKAPVYKIFKALILPIAE
jgi:hypothetical protein